MKLIWTWQTAAHTRIVKEQNAKVLMMKTFLTYRYILSLKSQWSPQVPLLK